MAELIKRILRAIISLIPVKKTVWIFGAWRGQLFADNSRYMFEYVNSAHQEIRAIWITRDPDTAENIREQGYSSFTRFSLRGIWAVARAGVAFETEGDQDISPLMNKKTKVVQLWHGVAPKKANWSDFNKKKERKIESYWMASSEQNKEILRELFGMSDDHVFVTGYPRNDTFVIPHEMHPVINELNQAFPGHRKVIYMPTHRNFGSEGMAFSKETMIALDNRLRNANIVMVFKPHFHELRNYLTMESEFTNIVLAKDQKKYQDVYGYVCDFDLLISDYSSIIYDFLCAKKPIILFPYDLEHFKSADAGLFDYFEGTPAGPFCFDWDQVVVHMIKLLDDDHNWIEKREQCRLMFHPFDDGLNRERVFEIARSLADI